VISLDIAMDFRRVSPAIAASARMSRSHASITNRRARHLTFRTRETVFYNWRMRCLPSFAALVFVLLSLTAPVTGFAFSLPADSRARVIAVIDGDTVKLDNGREVRLVGIQAPKLPLGRRGFTAWPLADEAKAKLEALTAERLVIPGYGHNPQLDPAFTAALLAFVARA